MRFIFRAFGWLLTWLVVGLIIFLGVVWVKSYDPKPIEELSVVGAADRFSKDTIKIISWNIGYAGLGSDMDFFYDGGRSVQTSLGRTEQNLRHIVSFIKSHADADFIMLQELDLSAKRSYGFNQYDTIINALGREFKGFMGLNYVSPYVPIPLANPMGNVRAGLATFSRYNPSKAVRYQYPGGFSWPESMFNLKRCLLSLEIPISDSATLYLNNTHNTAYDKGGMRIGEFEFLRTMFASTPYFIVAGDWNSTPVGYKPSSAETSDSHFSPLPIAANFFPEKWKFSFDRDRKTARYLYEPYNPQTTTSTLIDFALVGPNIVPIEAIVVDLGFENSDHNPVIYTFLIRR